MQIEASIYPELEVRLSAIYNAPRPAWGGSRWEPPTNPPEDASLEDISIDSLYYGKFNLLSGVNSANPEVQKLLTNLLNAAIASATDALFDAASDA